MTAGVKQAIRAYLVDTFLFGEGGDDLADDASLLEAGIIDSTGVLEVVAMLEGQYGIGVDDEELVPENFDSVERLVAFVQKKQSAKRGA